MQRPISKEEAEELKKHLDLSSPENEAAEYENKNGINMGTNSNLNISNIDPNAYNSFLQEEFKELLLKFPNCGIKSIDEIHNLENSAEVLSLWSKGVPLYRAYAAVNFEGILEKSALAVKQAVMNSLNSKKHLKRTKEGSYETSFVPPEVYREYKEFFPNWSESKIKADYRKRI
ncbi:MAG: hypothetical protein VB120_04985 [Lachnospiraceae bacterium]|nr:hypothetical protein [Lachnospiraceae bacterium]